MPAYDNVRQISCVPFSLKESNNWETEINSLHQTLEQAPCKHAGALTTLPLVTRLDH